MNKIQEFWNSRSQRDRIFWLVVIGLFLAYLLLQSRWQGSSPLILVSLLVLLIAITVHEFSHAWSADLLGDPTPRYMGRVTLNPLAHLDPAGTIMMVLTTLTGFGIGWGKPVMVSPRNFRLGARLGWGITALAGPASNMLLACFWLALRLTPHNITWLRLLELGVINNLSLAWFN
jgi:Zn-dependent protease